MRKHPLPCVDSQEMKLTVRFSAPPRSSQHYASWLQYTNGWRKHVWIIIQSGKTGKFCHLWQSGWTWRTLCLSWHKPGTEKLLCDVICWWNHSDSTQGCVCVVGETRRCCLKGTSFSWAVNVFWVLCLSEMLVNRKFARVCISHTQWQLQERPRQWPMEASTAGGGRVPQRTQNRARHIEHVARNRQAHRPGRNW